MARILCSVTVAAIALVGSAGWPARAGGGCADFDLDGVCDSVDNCPVGYNPDQTDRAVISGDPFDGANVIQYEVVEDALGLVVVYAVELATPGQYELYSRTLDGVVATLLSSAPVAGDGVDPFRVTPDGTRVVYRFRHQGLNKDRLTSVPTRGGPSISLFVPSFLPSVDDYEVAADSNDVVYRALRNLFTASLDGIDFQPIVEDFGDSWLGGWQLTADRKTVVFTHVLAQGKALQVKSRSVAPGGSNGDLYGPPSESSWGMKLGPASSIVVFSESDSFGLTFTALSTPIGGGGLTEVIPDTQTFDFGSLKITPDDSRIVFEDGSQVHSVPSAGGTIVPLSPVTAGSSLQFDVSVTEVVYTAAVDDPDNEELYIVPIIGGSSVKLNPPILTPSGDVHDPTFSQSATDVLFAGEIEVAGRDDLYSVPSVGGGATRIVPDDAASSVVSFGEVSPQTVLLLTDGAVELQSAPLLGGAATPISATGHTLVADAALSPDGAVITYAAAIDGGDTEVVAYALAPEGDGDGILDFCDNCPADLNADQADGDGDGRGDACDVCPADPADDGDDDGHCADVDNCPITSNSDQSDLDGDYVGDLCDGCPAVFNPAQTDGDTDGHPDACDNCPSLPNSGQEDGDLDSVGNLCDNCETTQNAKQFDGDGDGVGSLCDVCPGTPDDQTDGDGDGAGDVCDCDPNDPNDLPPSGITLSADRGGGGSTELSWTGVTGADLYSVHRVALSALSLGQYGPCLEDGTSQLDLIDGDPAPPGDGFGYLVQPQNLDCGLGSLGFDSDEAERQNTTPGSCQGLAPIDSSAAAEETIDGTVAGSFGDTVASDDVAQAITEVESSGNPANRFSFLEHRWTFAVTPAAALELHVEGFRSISPDGDDFVFEYSTDAGSSWIPAGIPQLPGADDDVDLVASLPSSLDGTVLVRVVDTDRTPGHRDLDTISVDQLFIRAIP